MNEARPILLVEDDDSVRRSLVNLLNEHGYPTISAENLQDGAHKLQSAKPALCLLDVNLPDGNGLDLLHLAVKQALKVVVMTAMPPAHRVNHAQQVIAWMVKPVNPQELLQIVRSATQGTQHEAPVTGRG